MSNKKSSTSSSTTERRKLIHVAKILRPKRGWIWLHLYEIGQDGAFWFEQDAEGNSASTGIGGSHIEIAIREARRAWKAESFTTLHCGYRFTLPERDEIGTNALFCQLTASLNTWNGVYFDEDLGHQCIVKEYSKEAHNLWRTLTHAQLIHDKG